MHSSVSLLGPEEHLCNTQGFSSSPNIVQPPCSSSFPCRSTSVATNTCCSAPEQVQQGHQQPQMQEALILTSLLSGGARGNREGNSPVGEVFTAFLPGLPVLSPQHTPFFPEGISHPATPLPHFQTVHHPGAQQPVPGPQAQSSPSSPCLGTELGTPSQPHTTSAPSALSNNGQRGFLLPF